MLLGALMLVMGPPSSFATSWPMRTSPGAALKAMAMPFSVKAKQRGPMDLGAVRLCAASSLT